MINKDIKTNDDTAFLSYDEAFQLVKDEVDKILSTSPLIIRGYTKHLATSMGKFIRAKALLICARKGDGSIHPNAVKFAAAIELLHLATLVHDDIIDNAEIRRGVATLQKKYGSRTAVICGDYLLCVALTLAASVENKEDYIDMNMPHYMEKVCLGELNQHVNNGNYNLTVRGYLKIIAGKTAALFEGSFYAGAILCEKDEKALQKYKRLGRYVGMIFQLTDDCMDFETTEAVAQKPVQSDFEQNVITLPLIHAFKNMDGLKERAEKAGLSRKDVDLAVLKAGGLGYTRMIANRYYKKSQAIVNELELSQEKRADLMAILDKANRVFA